MPTPIDDQITGLCVAAGIKDEPGEARIKEHMLPITQSFMSEATSLDALGKDADKKDSDGRTILERVFALALSEFKAERAEAEEKNGGVDLHKMHESISMAACAKGGPDSIRAQRELCKLYETELNLTPAQAAQMAATKLGEHDMKLGSTAAQPKFGIGKKTRKAIEAAAERGEIELTEPLPKKKKDKPTSADALANPYLMNPKNPDRQQRIIQLMRNPKKASELARAASCTLAGAPLAK